MTGKLAAAFDALLAAYHARDIDVDRSVAAAAKRHRAAINRLAARLQAARDNPDA